MCICNPTNAVVGGGGSFLSFPYNLRNIFWTLLPYAVFILYSVTIIIYLFIYLVNYLFIRSFIHAFIYLLFFITFCDLRLRQSATFPVPEPAQPLRVVSREGDC
jgi:cellulose synthase/poly-beta-1,6-N-acetylglucosamine synthase-like glycosyltransferase